MTLPAVDSYAAANNLGSLNRSPRTAWTRSSTTPAHTLSRAAARRPRVTREPSLSTPWRRTADGADRASRSIDLSQQQHASRRRRFTARHRLGRAALGPEPAYSESKLYVAALAFAVARRWRDVLSNAVDPGWVPTKMGGPRAPDDLEMGRLTQTWPGLARTRLRLALERK
jgi:NAD(P)-dependent dehydrogenase (short-subunit alcohol dehydrogenase family)